MRAVVALGMLLATGLASAQSESQAYLTCGTVACAPNINAVYYVGEVTGINDLNVGGDYFDVSFTSTAPALSPFVVSSTTAAPGEPLTGIDAGDAIAKVYGSLPPPYGGYEIEDDRGPTFITAFGAAGSLSSEYFGSTELYDLVITNVGGGTDFNNVVQDGKIQNNFITSSESINADVNSVYYTTWTPIAAAPEIDPNFAGSGLMLLIGGLAVALGRRPQRRAA